MRQTSKTGLTASTAKKLPYDRPRQVNVQLKTIAIPAPFAWKPYSGFYNPYSPGCSLLCNHPVDQDARDLLRKAKDSWTNKSARRAFLDDELESIRTGLNQLSFREAKVNDYASQVDSVPEELFRRYTETDSRPLTPAPTLASAATRASATRRCVTPEAGTGNGKARLVLDLRRTHSQETISYSASLQYPPLIRIQHVPTKTVSLEHLPRFGASPSRRSLPVQTPRKVKTAVVNVKPDRRQAPEPTKPAGNERKDEEPEEVVKRRGKKKRKKERDASRGPPAFQASLDPETQVATIGVDSANPSARTSLVPGTADHQESSCADGKRRSLKPRRSLDVDSYLDAEILKQLRRELDEEMVDVELNPKRRKALQEALKAVSKDKRDCDELVALQKELKLPPLNSDLWISLPRTFTRSSARFELPMDGGSLAKMTPLTYAREHVFVSSGRKLLFNCVFNKFKMEADLENEYDRKLAGGSLQEALDLLMGRAMTPDEAVYFRNLLEWRDEDVFDFRSFCGVAALCERVMAPAYCPRLPDREEDPCHEIETTDFEVLERKLYMQEPNPKFFELLQCLKTK